MILFAVHYEGTLAETGEVFDTTHVDNTIFSFEIGSGSVIKAWDVALRTMKVEYMVWVLILSFSFNYLITYMPDICLRSGRFQKSLAEQTMLMELLDLPQKYHQSNAQFVCLF